MAEQLGTTALTALAAPADRRRRAATPATRSARRRLESDAEAVQVLTIHRSKGLEFPIVYCPFLWDPTWIRDDARAGRLPRPDAGDRRTIDVGARGRGLRAHRKRAALAEQRGEDLRLAYVALTRARHQAVVWWAGSWDTPQLAARRACCFARDEDGDVRRRRRRRPTDDDGARSASTRSPRRRRARDRVERVDLGPPPRWEPAAARADATLAGRALRPRGSTATGAARRTATSPRGAHEARRGQRAGGTAASTTSPTAGIPPPGRRRARPTRALARRPVAAGRHAGRRRASARSCTRSSRRPTSPRPTSMPSCDARVREALAWRAVDVGDRRRSSPGCARRSRRRSARSPAACGCATSRAPTGSTSSSSSCRSPAATTPTATVALGAIAAVLRAHLPAGDPLAGYADRLERPGAARRGARLPHRQHRPRRAAARRGRRAPLRRRRLQDQPARARRASR